ncbi:MAG TPA: hopanoid biosynthesis-associated protein HpnK [Steroidobacteraceae bacterium]
MPTPPEPGATSDFAPARRRARFVIVTADDFGQHEAVNEAVERASREGILCAASLMVGAPASADAVRRARALPDLRVGLHLVLVEGAPLLPLDEVALLLGRDRRFDERMGIAGARYFLSPRARRQLRAEIRAQFRAFAASGLVLDHVNAHKHFHLHPTVLGLMLQVGQEFGLKAVRYPFEPAGLRGPTSLRERTGAAALQPWLRLMRARLRRAGVSHNDQLCGIGRSGRMDEVALERALQALPEGVTEIYLHPATQSGAQIAPSTSHYRHTEEFAALLSPRVRAALGATPRGGFTDWLQRRHR